MEHVEHTFVLSVPSDTRNLAMIRDFVEDAVRRSTMTGSDSDKLKLAVDEACANVIEHAYGNDKTKKLTIRVSFDASQVIVDVVDSGHTYDPTSHAPATLDELAASRRDGGMGIRLMRWRPTSSSGSPTSRGTTASGSSSASRRRRTASPLTPRFMSVQGYENTPDAERRLIELATCSRSARRSTNRSSSTRF